MSNYARKLVLVVLVELGSCAAHALAGLQVSDWFIASGVSDQSGSNRQFSNIVTNPFNDTHHAQIGPTYVETSHFFSWAGDDGYFQMHSVQHMEQLDGSVGTNALINFSVSNDSILTFSGRYSYAWPSNVFATSNLGAFVYDYTDDVAPFEDGVTGGNVGLGPPFGSLVFNASALLTGGHNYAFHYSAGTQVFNPSNPGTFGTGTADITIAITPVPEPTALATIMAFSLLPLRHTKRRSSAIR
jgi:hypothetical protein